MKRSEINTILRESSEFVAASGFRLPPFSGWGPDKCCAMRQQAREVFDLGLGWDVTDFGFGEFEKRGLTLFTLRNGSPQGQPYSKPYAEKILIIRPGQVTPSHCHWKKTEDIINRGGGTLVVSLWNATPDDRPGEGAVHVVTDGTLREVPSGGCLRLEPGESITLEPRVFHSFWADPQSGTVLAGEVSSVNDDRTDNCFAEPQLRFPEIVEDETPWRLLVGDYASLPAEPACGTPYEH